MTSHHLLVIAIVFEASVTASIFYAQHHQALPGHFPYFYPSGNYPHYYQPHSYYQPSYHQSYHYAHPLYTGYYRAYGHPYSTFGYVIPTYTYGNPAQYYRNWNPSWIPHLPASEVTRTITSFSSGNRKKPPGNNLKPSRAVCTSLEIFRTCGCERKCGELSGKLGCSCHSGCFCAFGFYRRADGECVPLKECTRACPLNERYSACGGECERTCTSDPPALCRCQPGCTCLAGYVRSGSRRSCVEEKECYKETLSN